MSWRRDLLACALCTAAGIAAAQPNAPDTRGRLLYETHCIACHDAQLHWREGKKVSDWSSLRAEVRRWQAGAQLGWSDEDVDAVSHYLNQRYYRLKAGAVQIGRSPSRGL